MIVDYVLCSDWGSCNLGFNIMLKRSNECIDCVAKLTLS